MSDVSLNLLEQSVLLPLHMIVSTAGVVTNVINIIIITKLGLTNSMGVSTLALAFSDLYVTFFDLFMCLLLVLRAVFPGSSIDMMSISGITLVTIRYPGFLISCWITAWMSIERCFAVVFPFRVKSKFTRFTATIAASVISIFFFCAVIPVLMTQTLGWKVVSSTDINGSVFEIKIFTVSLSDDWSFINSIVDTIGGSTLSGLSQTLVLICTAVMIYSLWSTSKIRQTHPSQSKGSTLSEREIRMVKVVLCLAVILTGCNVPRYIHLIVTYTVPTMCANFRLCYVVVYFTDLFIDVNCSSNFLVYMILNRKYKNRFVEMFGCKNSIKKIQPNFSLELESL